MQCCSPLEKAVKKANLEKSLRRRSKNKELVTDLQRILYELGFEKKLKWDKFQADGSYGKATQAAVKSFAKKNKIKRNGRSVSNKLAKTILQRYKFLPSMYILWEIGQSDLRKKKYISKGTRISIVAIQLLLNELGYGKQLKFAKYGADGLYGKATRKAMIAFANANDCECDGDLLTRPVIDLLLKEIDAFYGPSWTKLAQYHFEEKNPLVFFRGSRFVGTPCRADRKFVGLLNRINTYAEEADVDVYITSSFRTTTIVNGAIVPPATYSNHLIGHGIDMNLIYGKRKWANSTKMAKHPKVDPPVAMFLKAIIDDKDLRWGGTFRRKDAVHIDDGYNQNLAKWKKRYQVMQKAAQLGSS